MTTKTAVAAKRAKDTRTLRDLVSVGPATERDFHLLAITTVAQLKTKNPDILYERLCQVTGQRHDPCVRDVFRCAVEQAKNPNLPFEKCQWFYWSKIRKEKRR